LFWKTVVCSSVIFLGLTLTLTPLPL